MASHFQLNIKWKRTRQKKYPVKKDINSQMKHLIFNISCLFFGKIIEKIALLISCLFFNRLLKPTAKTLETPTTQKTEQRQQQQQKKKKGREEKTTLLFSRKNNKDPAIQSATLEGTL